MKTEFELKTMVLKYFDEFRSKRGILGYTYACDAILIALNDDKMLRQITKKAGLYDAIAKKHDSTIPRVERVMRHFIEDVSSKNSFLFREMFYDETPTNGEFVARIATEIKATLEMEEHGVIVVENVKQLSSGATTLENLGYEKDTTINDPYFTIYKKVESLGKTKVIVIKEYEVECYYQCVDCWRCKKDIASMNLEEIKAVEFLLTRLKSVQEVTS